MIPSKTKKAMVIDHSLLLNSSADEKAEIKKAMGAGKPPMAFTFNLNIDYGTGQTSASLFSQHHHQRFIINSKVIFILIIPFSRYFI
ncbi:MAG: hypothetical protein FJ115_05330 [Deltaproteobacteria bacterium]|nr:hypothetical protein [Deltaproteobacteria bacterium]